MQKKKKKKQVKRLNKILPKEIANDYKLWKYYIKRFGLFSRYEDGIKLDRGRYSIYLLKIINIFCMYEVIVILNISCRKLVFCNARRNSKEHSRKM